MAEGRKRKWLLGRWKTWVAIGVAVVLLLFLAWQLEGRRIRIWWVTRHIDQKPTAAMKAVRLLGRPYRDALASAILSGDYSFAGEVVLFQTAFGDPFYMSKRLRRALDSDEPVVRRAAVVAYLDRDREDERGQDRGKGRGPIADDVFHALQRWATSSNVNSVYLGAAVSRLDGFEDPRIPRLLIPLLLAKSSGKSLIDVGRANDARQKAALVLASYLDGPAEPEVAKALEEVVKRRPKEESSMVQARAWQALAMGGYGNDPALYWVAARSEDPIIRQMVADNLEKVKNPKVIPILTALLGDRKDVVRRGALDSLIAKHAPVVMDRIHDLAEDQFSSIRGDLADAVGRYRRRDLIPFVAWCLTDTDPIVVYKSMIALFKLTGAPVALDQKQWREFQRGGTRKQLELVKEFMNDDARKERVVAELAQRYPPRYTDWDRIPHLIAALSDADPDNVLRAVRLLTRITGRKKVFDPDLLDPGLPAVREANALEKLLHQDDLRAKAIANYEHWWKTTGRDLPPEERPKPPDADHTAAGDLLGPGPPAGK